MSPLKRELMSMKPGLRSLPASESASAEEYQVSGITPGAKSENTKVVPAEPSVALVGVQASGWKLAPT